MVRGNISVELDESGEFVEVKQILDTIENDKLMNRLIRKGSDNVNGYQYILTNDFGIIGRFAPNDSKLVQITPEGEKCILYDVSKRYHTTLIFLIILVLLIISIVFIGFIRMFIRIARDPHFGES
ncbi:hypothetical protein [Ligaoa zhengdingensis]|uniref:hypothetical protein n=1 Tax=Ligaoa zhengdingensis TaxID=2763658 RepID=UPI0031BA07F5